MDFLTNGYLLIAMMGGFLIGMTVWIALQKRRNKLFAEFTREVGGERIIVGSLATKLNTPKIHIKVASKMKEFRVKLKRAALKKPDGSPFVFYDIDKSRDPLDPDGMFKPLTDDEKKALSPEEAEVYVSDKSKLLPNLISTLSGKKESVKQLALGILIGVVMGGMAGILLGIIHPIINVCPVGDVCTAIQHVVTSTSTTSTSTSIAGFNGVAP